VASNRAGPPRVSALAPPFIKAPHGERTLPPVQFRTVQNQ